MGRDGLKGEVCLHAVLNRVATLDGIPANPIHTYIYGMEWEFALEWNGYMQEWEFALEWNGYMHGMGTGICFGMGMGFQTHATIFLRVMSSSSLLANCSW